MFITEHDDGSVTFTGSFNRQAWDQFLADRGLPASDEAAGVPRGLAADGKPDLPPAQPQADPQTVEEAPEQPAGNASTDEWRAFAVAQGASEEEVADLTRNELRDNYGTEES